MTKNIDTTNSDVVSITRVYTGYEHHIVEIVSRLNLTDQEAINRADFKAEAPFGGIVESKELKQNGNYRYRIRIFTQ